MKKGLFVVSIIVLVSVCVVPAYAKGSPDQIVITGGGVSLKITDQETLRKFDPWNGQFINWTSGQLSPPDDKGESYEVLFYMKWPGRRSDYDQGALKMIYAVRYLAGRDGTPGYVYLPGKGEKFCRYNTGTISREQDDGKWHRASAEWDAAMKRLLTANDPGQDSPGNKLWFAALSALENCWLFGE